MSTSLYHISPGNHIPVEVNAVIEIPQASRIKFEYNDTMGTVMIDRYLPTPMAYPLNYGFIPQTKADDGDCTDIMVFHPVPLPPLSVISVRIIGMLNMEDENGQDEKLIGVPVHKVSAFYDSVTDINHITKPKKEEIIHFFTHYKDLEEGKWVKIMGFTTVSTAQRVLEKHLKQYKS